MKLILHIGMQKTGTTSLQDALAGKHTALLRHGVLYPKVKIHPTNHIFLAALVRGGQQQSTRYRMLYGDDTAALWKDIETSWAQIKRQVVRHRPHTLILSGESLFRALETGDPSRLLARLRELSDDIRAVAYVRQPSRHYLSTMQQRVKASSRFSPPAPASIRRPLEMCEVLFGRRPDVVAYERESLLQGDIARDFLARFVPEAAPVVGEISSPVLNQSLSAESMAILQDHRESTHPGEDGRLTPDSVRWRRQLRQIEQRYDLYRRPALKSEVERYIDQTSVDLLWLAENYGIRFSGIDYDAIEAVPENPFQWCRKVADICEVDPTRQQRILTLVNRELSSRRFRIPDRLMIWIYKNAGNRALRWARHGLHWYRQRSDAGARRPHLK